MSERQSWRPVWSALAPATVMLVIFYLSSQVPTDSDLAWWEVLLRKLGHVTEYAMLTAAWWWALSSLLRRPQPIRAAIALSILFAVTDEYHQSFVDGRHATPVDVLIDALGIALSAVIVNRRAPETFALPAPGGR